MIGVKCAPLITVDEENTDIETLTDNFDNAVTDTVSEIEIEDNLNKNKIAFQVVKDLTRLYKSQAKEMRR